jgi:hypothetical protein
MSRQLTADERFAVIDTIQRYARAVDSGDFALFDETFTPDADLDYRSAGGPRGGRDEVRAWLAQSRSALLVWQHHLSPPMIEIDGETVRTRTDVYTPTLFRDATGKVHALDTGGRYHDELVTTPHGWRIAKRRYENVWADGAGAGSMIPDPRG